MKRFVIGDIHGAYKALKQVLERSSFNYDEDLLICLGDVADGWSEVPECFDELLKIENLIYVMGNHDYWLYEWFIKGASPYIWLSQGGQATVDAYIKKFTEESTEIAQRHEGLLRKSLYYYISEDNKLFVHGGFDWHIPIEENDIHDLMWDRHAYATAWGWELFKRVHPDKEQSWFKQYDEVFIGHTATNYNYGKQKASDVPLNLMNLWALDQGAGWSGKLSIMNVDTKEYWQSDKVMSLYPNERGRL